MSPHILLLKTPLTIHNFIRNKFVLKIKKFVYRKVPTYHQIIYFM